MRIVSDKKDYYDCIQEHGQDRSIFYIRQPEVINIRSKNWMKLQFGKFVFPEVHNVLINNIVAEQYIIGFCGKIYPVNCVYEEFIKDQRDERVYSYCFSNDDLDKTLKNLMTPKSFERYSGDVFKKGNRNKRYYFPRNDLAAFYQKCSEEQDSYSEMFIEKKSPIFVVDYKRETLTWNPLLRPFEFFRVFEPSLAFQEIYMWLSNQAVPHKPIYEPTNQEKIDTHGFNEESFRQPKAKYSI